MSIAVRVEGITPAACRGGRWRDLAAAAMASLMLAWPAAASAADSPGLVIDVQGSATLAGKGRLAILTGLASGAEVSLAPAARVVVIDSASGRQFELLGPGAFRWTSGAVEIVRPGKVLARSPEKGAMKEVRLRTARIAQASITMRGGEEGRPVRLAYPVSTWLIDRPKTFRWEPVSGAKTYRFQLTDAQGRPLHESRTASTSLDLPASVALEAGETYGWQVWAELADGRTPEGWTEFGLAGPDLRARVERDRPADDARFGDRLLYALLLEELGVRDDAARLWQELARERPDDPALPARATAR